MKSWAERPHEVAYLLNPAFTGLVLNGAIKGHENEGGVGIPFPLVYLILPIVLHETTKKSLPDRISSSMPTWLQENPHAMTQLPERTRNFRSYTQESIRFLSARRMISITSAGLVQAGPVPGPSVHKQKKAIGVEEYTAISASAFLGRWFARTGNVATIMTLWGIRP